MSIPVRAVSARAVGAVVVVVVGLLVGAGCGDDDGAAPTPTPTTEQDADPTTTSSGGTPSAPSTSSTTGPSVPIVASEVVEIADDMPTRIEAGPVTWVIEVDNTTDEPVRLTFPTGQLGDAVLLDGDREVYRWSAGRFFAQQVMERIFGTDGPETVTFDGDLSGVEPGSYSLVLSLNVSGAPDPIETRIRIVAPT